MMAVNKSMSLESRDNFNQDLRDGIILIYHIEETTEKAAKKCPTHLLTAHKIWQYSAAVGLIGEATFAANTEMMFLR